MLAVFAFGYWLGQRRGEKQTLARVQHHSVPMDVYQRLDFTTTDRMPLSVVHVLSEADMIRPLHNERNRLTLSEWPVPPTKS